MSIRPRIPSGGFFAARGCGNAEDLLACIGARGGRARYLTGPDVVLAAWTDFAGQGLWGGQGSAVAYDLDLTNEPELRALVGWAPGEERDPGELIAALYRELGMGFIDRLRGAFGFTLWDEGSQSLVAATDPYGIRPVVYSATERATVFASRIRHILLHPAVRRDLDPEAIYDYLFFSAIPTPLTVYRDVRKLAPGHLALASRGELSLRQYYDIVYDPDHSAGEAHWRQAVRSEVRKAVAHYVPLSAPARTGCFLSGGTDSSSVAGLYTELAGTPARTFSIGFDEPGYNELEYAHEAARHFGTEQHDYYVTPEDVLTLIEALPEIYDEPFGNSSVIPTFYCASLAGQAGVDVLLAGDGGDEIFGGNERYVTNLTFERYGKLPPLVRKVLVEPALSCLPQSGIVHKASRYVRRANIPNPDRFFSYNLLYETDPGEIFRPEFLEQVDPDCFLCLARAHYERAAPADDTDRLLYLDMKFTITDNDLRKVTQMTEAAGVRVRYPLLDRGLVDFTGTIPPGLKVQPGKNRYIFKRAMEGFLPDEIIRKTKHGFGLPIAPWFRGHASLGALLQEILFSGSARLRDWLRPEFLERMKRSFESDATTYYGANFWVLLVLEQWMLRWGSRSEETAA